MKRLLTYWLLLCACVIAQPELTNTEATNIDTPAERQAWREALELWTDDSPTFLGGTYTGDLSVGSKLTVGNGALDDTHIVNIVSAEDVITEVMLHLEWNSPTPAAGDSNALLFSMYDSALNETEYSRFRSVIEDPTDGTEDGAMTVDVLNNGVLEQAVLFSHDEIIMNDNGADRNFIVKDNTTAEVLRITGGTGSIAMDGSTLFVDSANNRVGVRTNTPNEALEVVGTILVNSGSWTGSTFTGTQSFASGARVVGELYSFVGSELAGNQVLGKGALSSFLGGVRNTAIGYNAGYTSTIISDSTYVGHQTTGSHNGITVLGSSASATGLNAIAIGRQASAGANELVIGTDANIASGTIWGTIDFPDSITTSGTNILSATDFTGQVEMTGDLTVDTTTLHVDSVNNAVGIGTASPDAGYLLHVNGSSGDVKLNDAGTMLEFTRNSTSYIRASNGVGNIALTCGTVIDAASRLTWSDSSLGISTVSTAELVNIGNVNGGRIGFDANSGTWDGATLTGNQAFTGNLTVDTDTLFVDASTNRVGIGLASLPPATLAIQKDDSTPFFASGIPSALEAQVRVYNPSTTANTAAGMVFVNRASGSAFSGIFGVAPSANNSELVFAVENADTIQEAMRLDPSTLDLGSGYSLSFAANSGTWDGSVLTGSQSFSGQVELTGQAASTDDSAMTRSLSDTRYGQKLRVSKTAATSRNTTTTLADDPDLVLTFPETGEYLLRIQFSTYDNSTGGFKYDFAGTATYGVRQRLRGSTIANQTAITSSSPAATMPSEDVSPWANSTRVGYWQGVIYVTATGTITFRWAQNTSNANNTQVHAGSYMTLEKLD